MRCDFFRKIKLKLNYKFTFLSVYSYLFTWLSSIRFLSIYPTIYLSINWPIYLPAFRLPLYRPSITSRHQPLRSWRLAGGWLLAPMAHTKWKTSSWFYFIPLRQTMGFRWTISKENTKILAGQKSSEWLICIWIKSREAPRTLPEYSSEMMWRLESNISIITYFLFRRVAIHNVTQTFFTHPHILHRIAKYTTFKICSFNTLSFPFTINIEIAILFNAHTVYKE